ncbi:CHAD domain-containing protein [Pseudomonas putida]|uniref:CHAD domain-containing protein n=1 Tax=Pseudomonas putida TaxID=303 RepID=UPI00357112F8
MSDMVDHLIAQIITLHVKLQACRERLAVNTDSEALHDLRTTVRRLRSLVRPMRGLPGVEQLENAAKAMGTLTTPLRDGEVLGAALIAQGFEQAGRRRLQGRGPSYARVARSPQLTRLLAMVDAFPAFMRSADRDGLIQALDKRIEKRLRKQWRKLAEALQDPDHDRHRLRLLIKRARYADEAYPQFGHASKNLRRTLKRAQGDLGDWHDRLQWLLQAQQHADLAVCIGPWQRQLGEAERRSDSTLNALGDALAHRKPGQ